jgi:hypothetical protein
VLLGISDKATDVNDKSVVLGVSVHRDYIVKSFILDLSKTQERHMLAYKTSLALAEEWFVG